MHPFVERMRKLYKLRTIQCCCYNYKLCFSCKRKNVTQFSDMVHECLVLFWFQGRTVLLLFWGFFFHKFFVHVYCKNVSTFLLTSKLYVHVLMSKHLQFLTFLRAACVDDRLHFISTEIRTLGKLQEGYLFHMHFFTKAIFQTNLFCFQFEFSNQHSKYQVFA